MTEQIYDRIGKGYARTRQPDPRIAAVILGALGRARTVVNVGAGAGAYEPADRPVVAVEPSTTMIAQRAPGSAPVVRASAIDLPFRDGAFEAALAVLTVHHWPDRPRGLAELARVASDRVVVLTWDPESEGFWLVRDYLPEILAIDREILPPLDELRSVLGPVEVTPVPVPHDCVDGFFGAFWRRPEAYLDPNVRGGISTFAKLRSAETGLARLRTDLEDGTWERRNRDLTTKTELDLGYRLVVSARPSGIEAPLRAVARGDRPPSDVRVTYDDMHGLWGGVTVDVSGDGAYERRRRDRGEPGPRVVRRSLGEGELRRLLDELVAIEAWRQETPDRAPVPDESRATLVVEIGGARRAMWEWYADLEKNGRLARVRDLLLAFGD